MDAFGEAIRKYFDETLEEERSNSGVTAVIRAVAKSKITSLRGKFGKHLGVANSKLDDKFLDEVILQPSLLYFEFLNIFILLILSFISAQQWNFHTLWIMYVS
jgi:hypothetical protein